MEVRHEGDGFVEVVSGDLLFTMWKEGYLAINTMSNQASTLLLHDEFAEIVRFWRAYIEYSVEF